ncbi:MAG: hypothetical protein D6778_06500, partial [Nitrospirae bacterium]
EIFLEVLPPGRSQPVRTDFDDIVFGFKLHPEKEIKKGILTGRVYNLQNPRYELTVQWTRDAKRPPIRWVLGPGSSATGESLSLKLGTGALAIKALAVKDPVVPLAYFFVAAFALSVLIFPLRLFWFRQRVVVEKTEGSWLIRLQRQQYERWSEEFLEGIIQGSGKSS